MLKFDPVSRPAYLALCGVFVLGFFLVAVTGFAVSWTIFASYWFFPLLSISGGLLRQKGLCRFATCIETIGMIYWQGIAACLAVIPMAALSGPMADGLLANADAALGFHWRSFVFALRPAFDPIAFAYHSIFLQPIIIVSLLSWRASHDRCWQFALAGTLALLVTVCIFPFFPADGSFIHYGVTPQQYPPFNDHSPPWSFSPIIHKIKDGYRLLDTSVLGGLVSFPSYHAASAAIFVWALWPVRIARVFGLILNILLVLGSFVLGAHYLVDILAGMLIAMLSVAAAKRLILGASEGFQIPVPA